MQPHILSEIGQCYMSSTCTAPPSPVVLTHIRDGLNFGPLGEIVKVSLCGMHAREAMQWGFRVHTEFPAVRVTQRVPSHIRLHATYIREQLSYTAWTEVGEAPREWDSNGCKIMSKLTGGGLSFALFHSRTYGCPVG